MRKSKVPPGASWYHAMNRVERGASWIRSRVQASAFLARVAVTCGELPLEVHAYCLLSRHYHLLVRAEPDPLREALSLLEETTAFPRAQKPRALPVAFGRHLMSVSRYIHLNPVDAGLVWCPEEWLYSSFRGYLGDLTAPRFLFTEAVLGRFGTIGARHRHRAYVYAGMDPGTRDGDGRPRWDSLFGSGSPVEDSAWRIEPVLRSQAARLTVTYSGASLQCLARVVADAFDVPAEALRKARSGGATAALARGALVHAARAQGRRKLIDVAAFMHYASPATAAAAAERFERALRADPDLSHRLRAVVATATSTSRAEPRGLPPAPSACPCPPGGISD
jgi:REP element-mobilizing transposase RayT